jgi:hypothetical protein
MLAHRLALLKGVWAAFATGYEAQTGEPVLDQLLSRGGDGEHAGYRLADLYRSCLRCRGRACGPSRSLDRAGLSPGTTRGRAGCGSANHPERRGSVPHLSPYPATSTQDERTSPTPPSTAAFASVRPRSDQADEWIGLELLVLGMPTNEALELLVSLLPTQRRSQPCADTFHRAQRLHGPLSRVTDVGMLDDQPVLELEARS